MGEKRKRRVEIEKIEDWNQRKVSFCKRRKGVFKKAAEFSRLFGVDVLSVAFSPSGNPFLFSSTPQDVLLRKAATFTTSTSSNSSNPPSSSSQTISNSTQTQTPQPPSPSPSPSDMKRLLSTIDVSQIPPHQLGFYINALKNMRSYALHRLNQLNNNHNSVGATAGPEEQQQQQQQQDENEEEKNNSFGDDDDFQFQRIQPQHQHQLGSLTVEINRLRNAVSPGSVKN